VPTIVFVEDEGEDQNSQEKKKLFKAEVVGVGCLFAAFSVTSDCVLNLAVDALGTGFKIYASRPSWFALLVLVFSSVYCVRVNISQNTP
jgi:hypothetical protein